MKFSGSRLLLIALLLSALLASGCAMDPRYDNAKFHLPKRANTESAMIIGRIDLPDNKEENPDDRHLLLYSVVFRNAARGVYFCQGNMPCGERAYTMYNSYFVVPNLKPGKYYFNGFATGNVFNSIPFNKDDFIELRPGEIKYIGSLDYMDVKQSAVKSFFGVPGSFGLRPAQHPSELEMLHWLSSSSQGSGWEGVIENRITALERGAKVSAKHSASKSARK